jgi:hypothetical protein
LTVRPGRRDKTGCRTKEAKKVSDLAKKLFKSDLDMVKKKE